MVGDELFTNLVLKRQREIEAHSADLGGMHVSWLPRLVTALAKVVEYGGRMALPHGDHDDARNYQNALLNLAAVALAAMPRAKAV